LLYLSWRFTSGFGLIPQSDLAREPMLALWKFKENVYSIISWWIGPRMLWAGVNGLEMWPWMGWVRGVMLAILNVGLLAWLLRLASRLPEPSAPQPWSHARIALWAVLLMALTHAPSLPGWTASRLNYLPGLGAATLLGLLWVKAQGKPALRGVFIAGVLLGFFANQGISKEWQVLGAFQAGLYERIDASFDEWQDKDLVLVSSDRLQQHSGYKSWRPDKTTHVLALYRNAPLLWGTVLNAMIQRSAAENDGSPPRIILDIETNPRVEGEWLIWHERFKPDQVQSNDLSRIYRMTAWPAEEEMKL